MCVIVCVKPTVDEAAERQDVQGEDPSVHPQQPRVTVERRETEWNSS